ncbi:MAG: OmpA family protein [Novosphingobium sp.]|nr:OmpA family protein [Novosphingobium sp.]
MSRKACLFAFAAILPSMAMAQSADEEKTPEQIQCELSDDCASAAAEAPKTRSWSWGNRTSSSTTASPAATPVKRPAAAYAGRSSRASMSKDYGRKSSRLAISFASGSDELTPAGRQQADALFKAISAKGMSGHHYLIAGHTDASGSSDLNLDLSRRRAQALVDYLAAKGIPQSHFRARGYGFERPLPGTSANASINRRVEVTKLD